MRSLCGRVRQVDINTFPKETIISFYWYDKSAIYMGTCASLRQPLLLADAAPWILVGIFLSES